jgi:phosphoribosyl 1,2-cyclic phosphodiesterase
MLVHTAGTRGSAPVSGQQSQRYGGNTTCIRVDSTCLPQNHWLVVDAGTGIIPVGWDFVNKGGKALTLLQTHFHHDHTQGLPLSVFPYLKETPIDIWGPLDHGFGPKEVYKSLMRSPFFPIGFGCVASHMQCFAIENPTTTVLVMHPVGGVMRFPLDQFERLCAAGKQIQFRKHYKFALAQCLVVTMFRSNHPEQTISYRFTEHPTRTSFVFLTDHESQKAIPVNLLAHVQNADLLIEDCQYTVEKYQNVTAGWGHATPDYVAELAVKAGVKALGLTHHDPPSSDDLVDEIVATATRYVSESSRTIPVFGCYDGMTIAVGKDTNEI